MMSIEQSWSFNEQPDWRPERRPVDENLGREHGERRAEDADANQGEGVVVILQLAVRIGVVVAGLSTVALPGSARVSWEESEEKTMATLPTPLVTRSDEVLSGTVVFAGTRVPVQTLIDYLEEGGRLDDFLDDFPTVSREHAVAVLELAKESVFATAA